MPYRRGMIAAWVFDIELRRATDGRHGLTDVLLDLIDSKPQGGVVRRKHFEFLGMLAHEHLHNWYPNAMRSDLGPWFMEGLNDYVAYRGLLANGLHTREQFSGMLSKWHREY